MLLQTIIIMNMTSITGSIGTRFWGGVFTGPVSVEFEDVEIRNEEG